MAKRLLAALFILISTSGAASGTRVYVASLYGVVNPPMADYIVSVIDKAEKRNSVVLILLDTPGGLDASMRVIVSKIMNARVPVITYVYPPGARAASAGLFILVSGHIAAMAYGTNTGAAHPVSLGVKMDKTMKEKVTNDAVAFIKSIAEKRGHFSKILIEMVAKSRSLTEEEALKAHIIDLVAFDVRDLLDKVDGRRVRVRDSVWVLKTKGARVKKIPMNFRQRFFYFISHPNVAYIMAVLGFYGLLFELSNPGLIFPGVVGFICLVLSFYSLHVLPLNYAGMALIIFAFLLFVLEVKLPTHGLLGIGGFFSFLIGSLMLFDAPTPLLKPSLYVILSASVLTALFFMFVVALAVKTLKKKPVSGKEGLLGEVGTAKTDITKEGGWVFVHGERWKAISDEVIRKGEKVKVVDVKGLTLKVKKLEEDSDDTA